MVSRSAGLLPYHRSPDGEVSVFIAHMGGPLWARRDAGGWSIVKGEYDPATETPEQVAAREFREEIGVEAPPPPWSALGEFRQKSGKIVTAFAVRMPVPDDLAFVASNTFEMEWPRGSGRLREFPEIDRAEWVAVDTARAKLVSGQVPMLDVVLRLSGR